MQFYSEANAKSARYKINTTKEKTERKLMHHKLKKEIRIINEISRKQNTTL